MIVIPDCHLSEPSREQPPLWRRIREYRPSELTRLLYMAIIHPDDHLHHFTAADVKLLLERAGFCNISASGVPGIQNAYAFDARKPSMSRLCIR